MLPICTWRSPMIALKSCLSNKDYNDFIFHMKKENLLELHENTSNNPAIKELRSIALNELQNRLVKSKHKRGSIKS